MVRITESLIRKRAEHNECIISTLEEISLHQQDIERIEWLDKWCRDLKILYLQSNLIPKIENVSRLKNLDYLNLALNNVERVENLEGCESLRKLDLTVNFIGELTSIECMKDLVHFRDLYMTGNPCTDYDGYREYVIATLPQLQFLDGIEIEKSERIRAMQVLHVVRPSIIQQQERYRKKREKEKEEALREEGKSSKESKPGYDGNWYTDINNTDPENQKTSSEVAEPAESEDGLEKEKEFWDEKVPFTPEGRLAVHKHMEEKRKRETKEEVKPKKERMLQTEDGRYLNVNEAKVDFDLTEDEEKQAYILDVAIYKHMDTSLLDCDVQPTHVKVTLKGKVLQIVLPKEVNADNSKAERSQTTGHLVITMPKAHPVICAKPKPISKPKSTENKENHSKQPRKSHEKLEVDPSQAKSVDIGNIVKDPQSASTTAPLGRRTAQPSKIPERPNNEDFVDDPDVPPLM